MFFLHLDTYLKQQGDQHENGSYHNQQDAVLMECVYWGEIDDDIHQHPRKHGGNSDGRQNSLVDAAEYFSFFHVACHEIGQQADKENGITLNGLYQRFLYKSIVVVFSHFITERQYLAKAVSNGCKKAEYRNKVAVLHQALVGLGFHCSSV